MLRKKNGGLILFSPTHKVYCYTRNTIQANDKYNKPKQTELQPI
jgi:hypothetical protein